MDYFRTKDLRHELLVELTEYVSSMQVMVALGQLNL